MHQTKSIGQRCAKQALTKLKASLCGGPLLHSSNFDLTFLLQTDVLDRGLGAVMSQVVGGRNKKRDLIQHH